MSVSNVIREYSPKRRKLSEVLFENGDCSELADTIEIASKELRNARLQESRL
jgi:predicted CopG family antitoxin